MFVFSAPSETPFVPQKLEIFTSPEMPPTTPGNNDIFMVVYFERTDKVSREESVLLDFQSIFIVNIPFHSLS